MYTPGEQSIVFQQSGFLAKKKKATAASNADRKEVPVRSMRKGKCTSIKASVNWQKSPNAICPHRTPWEGDVERIVHHGGVIAFQNGEPKN